MYSSQEKELHSSLGQGMRKLAWVVNEEGLTRTPKSPLIIFLCGANKRNEEGLSERRKALKAFLEDQIKNSSVIIAEDFFEILKDKSSSHINLLDAEYFISHIADDVVIILESESAFCELGAFSHKELREKILVVNDSRFKDSPSFINTGPIEAINHSTSRKTTFHYPMQPSGIQELDGIGQIFYDIHKSITSQSSKKTKIKVKDLIPEKGNENSKNALMFASDLIYICSPLTYQELCALYISLFGDLRFNALTQIISLLIGMNLIKYEKPKTYICTNTSHLFYQYGKHEEDLLVTFRLNALKKGRLSNEPN